jgi:hypothetical protein
VLIRLSRTGSLRQVRSGSSRTNRKRGVICYIRAVAGLGPPPEFLSDGSWPPLESDSVLLAEAFTFVEGGCEAMNALLASDHDNLPADLRRARAEAVFQDFAAERHQHESWWPSRGCNEIRRITYKSHWRREDPVSQLAPGTSSEKRVRLETGLAASESEQLLASLEASQSHGLSGSLGAKIPTGFAEVGAKLGASVNRNLEAKLKQYLQKNIAITARSSLERTVSLTNDSASKKYRLFALWHPVETISVDVLDIKLLGTLCWMPLSRTCFAAPDLSAISMTASDMIIAP